MKRFSRLVLSALRFSMLIVTLAALMGISVTACSAGQSDSADRDVIGTLRVGVIGSVNVISGPLGLAHSRGEVLRALKPLGVDKIDVYNFPNGPDLNQALLGGRLDVGLYGDTPALVARGSGLQTRLLAISQFNNDAGVVVKNPSIRTLKDLAGKKIGVPKGSYIDRYLQGALQQAGITAQLIHLYPADQEAPLSSGEIDAAALPGVIPSVALQTFQRKGYRLIDSVYRNHPTSPAPARWHRRQRSWTSRRTSAPPGKSSSPTRSPMPRRIGTSTWPSRSRTPRPTPTTSARPPTPTAMPPNPSRPPASDSWREPRSSWSPAEASSRTSHWATGSTGRPTPDAHSTRWLSRGRSASKPPATQPYSQPPHTPPRQSSIRTPSCNRVATPPDNASSTRTRNTSVMRARASSTPIHSTALDSSETRVAPPTGSHR